MRKIFSILAVAVLLASTLFAAAPATQSIFPYKYEETTLPNGLTVILIPMKNAGLVSYFTVIHAGSRNEVEPGKSGFAHFFEHIMFRGTDKYPADVRNNIVTEMGADTNAFTSDDMTVYYLHFPDRYLEKVVDLESDRFMNLKYSLADFQTEARAVLGEYNKNFANPFVQLDEKMRDVSFEKSSYKHTTMGFIKDIQDMPNQYEYSLEFFKRFYRPNNATILVTGNIDSAKTLALIKQYYSNWKGSAVKVTQPAEPAQEKALTGKVDYQGQTLPILLLAYKTPAFSPASVEDAALTLLANYAFGETSALYKKLVLDEQKVDILAGDSDIHVDPFLFQIYTRVKKPEDVESVQKDLEATIESLKTTPIDEKTLAALKSNLKYGFLMSLDSSKSTASQLARILAYTWNIENINKMYATFQSVKPADIQRVAQTYFKDSGKTVITLTGGTK